MAMTVCHDCGKEISSKAKTCPACGAEPKRGVGWKTIVAVVLVAIWMLGIVLRDNDQQTTTTTVGASTKPSVSTPVISGSQWSYSHVADAMSKGTSYHAAVSSTNTVEFKFPYAGAQHARLNLRTDPRYGKDVIFSIEKGQLLCRSYENCTVLIRFDDERATNYSAVGAADNSTETAFIHNYDRFVGKMLKAKRVRISANIYQEGAPIFEFDVSGFAPSKYKPK